MKTFQSWFLLLSFWALVAIALFVGAPAHAQVAAGTSASSSSSSTTTTTTTATQAVAPQILQLPTVAYQAPVAAPLPVCPMPTFGAPLGYGYGHSFGASFGYGRTFGFHRGFGVPLGYSGVGFQRSRFIGPGYGVTAGVFTPGVNVVVPRRTTIRSTPRRTVIRIR